MASNTLIGALRTEATLESGKFVDGAKRIQASAKKTESTLKSSFGAMGASVKAFGVGLAASLSIGLLAGITKRALDFAGSLGEISQQLGVTTRDLQVFRFAAGQLGVSQEQLETGLQKLTVTLGQMAAGAKAPREALDSIRKGLADQVLQAKDTGDAFRIIADGLATVSDRSQRAAVEVALFGKSGAKLDNLLAGGSKALNELADAADRLGIVLSDEQIQKADETADKLEAVKTMLSAQIAGVVADNADAILQLANALLEVAAAATRALANVGKFVSFISANIGWITNPTAGFGKMAAGLGSSATVSLRTVKPGTYYDPTNFSLGDFKKKSAGGISKFLAPSKGGGGRSRRGGSDDASRKAEQARREAFQFDEELRRGQMDILRARQQLAGSAEARAALELQMLDLERTSLQAELDYEVAQGDRTKAQVAMILAQYDEADALRRQAIADDLAADKARDAADLLDSNYDLRLEQLQLEASLKETARERRQVELRILALMKEQEKARLEAVIADQQSSELAKAQASQRLAQLDAIYAGRADVVKQGTRGPMEDWLAQLPTTAAKAQEAFEQLQVQGFEGLIDAAVALTEGFDSAKDALLNTLKQFLQGVLRMQLQQSFGSLFGSGGFNLGSLFGGGSTIGSTPVFTSSNPGVGFAGGGSFSVMGRTGIDNNIMSINGIPIANVSYGERVSVSNDNSRSGSGRTVNQNFKVYAKDADSFHRSEGQILRTARRRLGV